jgi:restriction system protein
MEGVAMPKPDVHVVPHKGGWATRREGAERVSRSARRARPTPPAGLLLSTSGVEVVTHRRDGTIRDSDSSAAILFRPATGSIRGGRGMLLIGSVAATGSAARRTNEPPPSLTLKALLIPGSNTEQGLLVRAVAVPWFEIMKMLRQDPAAVYQLDWRRWEEIIAGAYTRAGFDEVILTPRSGDGGKDIIATKRGIGSIRIFDQVKAYKPTHLVDADEVRAMIGVITGHQNVSKGIITTTSDFAPRVVDDPSIAAFVPYRLELKPREPLLTWLEELSTSAR